METSMADTASSSAQAQRIRMRIGDQWHDADESQEVHDPYRGAVVAHAPV
jgi:hypothetical protein